MALRVLLADESVSIKKVMQLALQDFGVDVKSVSQGMDVVPVSKSFRPDIVFMDVLLSKKSGYETCLEIKSDPELEMTPVVLMWSGFLQIDVNKAKLSRCDAQLEKPFDAEILRNLVRKLVPRLRTNEIAPFLSFPKLPEIVDENAALGAPDSAMESDSPVVPEAESLPTLHPPMSAHEVDEPEEFQQVPLPKAGGGSQRTNLSGESRAALSTSEASSAENESWEHQDLARYKVTTPQEVSDEFAPPPGPEFNPATGSFHTASSLTFSPMTNPAPSDFIKADLAEMIVREKAQEIAYEIAWKLMPDIIERVVREELQKLMDKVEKL